MKTMTLDTVLKDDKISLEKVEGVKRRKIPFNVLRNIEMLKQLDNAAKLQIKLGLGLPDQRSNEQVLEIKKEINKYSVSRLLKAGFQTVQEPPVDLLPRFAPGNSKVFTSKPLLALAKLSNITDKITCQVRNKRGAVQNFEALIPRMPNTVLELAKRVKDNAPNAQFHLAFMPSWDKAPQKDPMLLARVGKHWFQVGLAWGGDRELLQEAVIPNSIALT